MGGGGHVRAVLVEADRDVADVLEAVFRAAGLPLRRTADRPGTPGLDALLSGFDAADLLVLDCSPPGGTAVGELVEAAPALPCSLVVLHPRLAEAGGARPVPGLGPGQEVWWWPTDFRVLTALDQLRWHVTATRAARAARAASADLSLLSEREKEVLELVAAGHSNTGIAERLDLSPGTVKTYVARGKEKLGEESRTGLRALLRRARSR